MGVGIATSAGCGFVMLTGLLGSSVHQASVVLYTPPLSTKTQKGSIMTRKLTIWTQSFVIALLERAIATFLQAFISAVGLDAIAIGARGWDGINWGPALGIAGAAALLAVFKGVIANIFTKDGPSATHQEKVVPPLPNVPAS